MTDEATSGSQIPIIDDTYDIGRPTKRFRNLYMSGTTAFSGPITTTSTIASTSSITTSGQFVSTASGSQIAFQPSGTIALLSVDSPTSNVSYNIKDTGTTTNTIIMTGKRYSFAATSSATLGQALASGLSGVKIHVNSAAAAVSATLPTPAAGLEFQIVICSATLANTVTISASSAIILGTLVSADGTPVTGGAITTAKTNVIIGTGAKFGDTYDFYSDGVKWFVKGTTSLNTSVTVS
jgi:hypothetical protein